MKRYLKLLVIMAVVLPVAGIAAACSGGSAKPLEGVYTFDSLAIKNVTFYLSDFDMDAINALMEKEEEPGLDDIVALIKQSGISKVNTLFGKLDASAIAEMTSGAAMVLHSDAYAVFQELLTTFEEAADFDGAIELINAAIEDKTITEADGVFFNACMEQYFAEDGDSSGDLSDQLDTYFIANHPLTNDDAKMMLEIGVMSLFAMQYGNELTLTSDENGEPNYTQDGNNITLIDGQGGLGENSNCVWNSLKGTLTYIQVDEEGSDVNVSLTYKRTGDVPQVIVF